MTQRLHLVFGGELIDPTKNAFKDVDDIHVVGMFADYESAFNAWKSEAQKTVDTPELNKMGVKTVIDDQGNVRVEPRG